jgi:hypothetical protein
MACCDHAQSSRLRGDLLVALVRTRVFLWSAAILSAIPTPCQPSQPPGLPGWVESSSLSELDI